MNVFASSADPVAAARALDDKRVNKMIVESCQILSAALHLRGMGSTDIYRPAYLRHPVVRWTAADQRNYAWLFRHLEALFDERTFRSGSGEHRSRRLVPILAQHVETDAAPVSFENCTPYKQIEDVHLAYRLTLADKWRQDVRPPTWLRRGPPEFVGVTLDGR
jgi:hypothetical protein